MLKADSNRFHRLIPFLTGGLGSALLIVNRLTTVQLTESQSRSDVVGVILSGVLILVGLIWQQVQPRSPDSVVLIGREGLEWGRDLPESVKTELAWASHLLLTNTVTRSLAIFYRGQTLLRRGVLGESDLIVPGAIVRRVMSQQKPVYLVNLALYPGKVEFDYLPENTQGVICQPLGNEGVLILGANAPRSYTRQDEAWIAGIADRLTLSLQEKVSNSF